MSGKQWLFDLKKYCLRPHPFIVKRSTNDKGNYGK